MGTRVSDSVLGPYEIDPHGDTTSKVYGGFEVKGGRLHLARLLNGA
jgi:acyl CoA:acetate/3-ketoacid CoA transferase beta subunit